MIEREKEAKIKRRERKIQTAIHVENGLFKQS